MPNDNQNKQNTAAKPISAPPPVLEDVVLPPMANNNPISQIPDKNASSGSAAPNNDVILQSQPISSNPRKKFAGGRVIATILGLFLLVGGLGAGILLVGQNQNPNEQAASCFDTCFRQTGDAVECNAICKWQNPTEPTVPPEKIPECSVVGPFCPSGEKCRNGKCVTAEAPPASAGSLGSRCDGPTNVGLPACANGLVCYGPQGPSSATCVSPSSIPNWTTGTICDASTPGVPESMGVCCSTGGTSYNYETGGSFTGKHWTTCASGYKCQQNYGCVEEPTTGPTNPPSNPPKVTPTPPAITASCQNLKAYPMSGNTSVPLTTAQLSALKSGNQFNLCVQGIKTGGSFDKVRFTINGVLQPEQAMTDRIGTTTEGQFCTVYTIPQVLPANGAFNFSAEMHHVTLGWR